MLVTNFQLILIMKFKTHKLNLIITIGRHGSKGIQAKTSWNSEFWTINYSNGCLCDISFVSLNCLAPTFV